MKRATLVIMLLGMVSFALLQAESLQGSNRCFTLGTRDLHTLNVQFRVPEFEITEETINGTVWNRIKVDNSSYLIEPGMPELPIITTSIAIPYYGQVNVDVTNAHLKTIRHIIPYPAQDQSGETPRALSVNQAFYQGSATYPQETIRYSDPQILRDFRIVTLQVQPFAWDSATQELIIRDQMDIRLSFNDAPGLNELSPPQQISSVWESIYTANILNFNDYRNMVVANTPPNIVIIYGTYNDATFLSKVQEFALWKKQKGANATVTICHTGTKDIGTHTRRADIIIVAAGKPKAVTADMVKEGVVVIDVGVNQIGTTADGKRILVGDVDFDAVKEKAKAITPVPGGVGPMTITMLMYNTVKAAKLAAGIK